MEINQKTKDIIVYVLAGLFGAGAITCAVFEGLGKQESWLLGLLAALGIIFAIVATFLVAKNLNNKDKKKAEEKKAEEIKNIEEGK